MPHWYPIDSVLLAQEQPGGAAGLLTMLMPILMIGLLFYVLMILPEKRKRAEIGKMQGSLKKNDRVVTIGGILGVVVNTHPGTERVTLRIDETNNTRIDVLRSSVARVLSDERSDSASEA